jgi:hypothetical protein
MTVKGIDVASYQSSDYSIANTQVVVVKATEGTSYINPRHAAQVARARSNHLIVGHYHFQRDGDPAKQAAYFLEHAVPKTGDFLACDWEDTRVSNAEKDAFIKAVRKDAPNFRTILYCNRDFWLHRDTTSYCGDGLWIADPSAPMGKPRVEHDWLGHQYGISGGMDRDIFDFATFAAMQAWTLKGQKPAAHPPAHEPYPGAHWFTHGRRSPIVTAMHHRLVAVGCGHYRTHTHLNVIGSGDVASYEAWQRKYNKDHHKGWSGSALKWPPGKETWDALKVPNV